VGEAVTVNAAAIDGASVAGGPSAHFDAVGSADDIAIVVGSAGEA
jgi:hypothetical protein